MKHRILYLTPSEVSSSTFPFFIENNIKRTFFIQDLECGTIESDIRTSSYWNIHFSFFSQYTNTLVYRIVAESSSSLLSKRKCKKRLRTLHLKKKIVVIKSPTTIAVASEQKRNGCAPPLFLFLLGDDNVA